VPDKVLINLARGWRTGSASSSLCWWPRQHRRRARKLSSGPRRMPFAWGSRAYCRESCARTVRHWSDWPSSTQTQAASCGCARSASVPVISPRPRRFQTRRWWERRRCRSGLAATRRSSATECQFSASHPVVSPLSTAWQIARRQASCSRRVARGKRRLEVIHRGGWGGGGAACASLDGRVRCCARLVSCACPGSASTGCSNAGRAR
jgi:hypothetical protein